MQDHETIYDKACMWEASHLYSWVHSIFKTISPGLPILSKYSPGTHLIIPSFLAASFNLPSIHLGDDRYGKDQFQDDLFLTANTSCVPHRELALLSSGLKFSYLPYGGPVILPARFLYNPPLRPPSLHLPPSHLLSIFLFSIHLSIIYPSIYLSILLSSHIIHSI